MEEKKLNTSKKNIIIKDKQIESKLETNVENTSNSGLSPEILKIILSQQEQNTKLMEQVTALMNKFVEENKASKRDYGNVDINNISKVTYDALQRRSNGELIPNEVQLLWKDIAFQKAEESSMRFTNLFYKALKIDTLADMFNRSETDLVKDYESFIVEERDTYKLNKVTRKPEKVHKVVYLKDLLGPLTPFSWNKEKAEKFGVVYQGAPLFGLHLNLAKVNGDRPYYLPSRIVNEFFSRIDVNPDKLEKRMSTITALDSVKKKDTTIQHFADASKYSINVGN